MQEPSTALVTRAALSRGRPLGVLWSQSIWAVRCDLVMGTGLLGCETNFPRVPSATSKPCPFTALRTAH